MLIKPVLSYLPSHHDFSLLVSPLRLTVMLQHCGSGWLLQMRLSSSSNFPLFLNFHPVLGGLLGSTPTGAFSRSSFSSSPTSQSFPNLMMKMDVFCQNFWAFLTCKASISSLLEFLWSEPVCRPGSRTFLHEAEDQTYQRLDPHGCCSHPRLTGTVL